MGTLCGGDALCRGRFVAGTDCSGTLRGGTDCGGDAMWRDAVEAPNDIQPKVS